MYYRKFLFLLAICYFFSLSQTFASKFDYTKYVNPRIGTGGHGHVFLGANVPFGLVQLGPTQYTRGWDWCSGYHYSDSLIRGFGHMHLSGTGIGDLGDIAILPVSEPSQKDVWFSHDDETVRPGYYSLKLQNPNLLVELTATERVGIHRYTFSDKSKDVLFRLDLKQGIGWDSHVQSGWTIRDKRHVEGYRRSKGWAKDQIIYFVAEFSQDVEQYLAEGDTICYLRPSDVSKPLVVKVALSSVDVEGARKNLLQESANLSFEEAVEKARRKWNDELSKIKIKTSDKDKLAVFYTAMYHSMIAPSVFSDVDGRYRGADNNIHKGGFTNYTTLSLWDTYRAAHPLMTLIHPEKQNDIANTFINIYRQQGKLPVWHLMGNETDCMIGNPGIPVLADLIMKGFVDDKESAYEALKGSALQDDRGLDLLKRYNYLPYDKDSTFETVAKGLEYALADDGVAKVAKLLGKTDDYNYFYNRSRTYRRYFDKSTGFMRGVGSDGKFREPFNPFNVVHRQDDYTEGNAWQYVWLVPHDVEGLIGLFGGKKQFVSKLDSLFVVSGDLGEDASPDISGLIGQYAHGNEPSHHILYLYNYIGQEYKAAPLLRKTMNELYTNSIDGLSGNEDVGQMSAWYILSSVGLYQVEPVGGKYMIGSPLFDEATLNVGNGKEFTIRAINNSETNIYVQAMRLNGKRYDKSYIMFNDIQKGGVLELLMGDKPTKRPPKDERLFSSEVIEDVIDSVTWMLKDNSKLAWMFANCFPNTLETTIHYRKTDNGDDDTFVYTGDIHAMWLRDSGAQVWPYVQFAAKDDSLKSMLRGVILRQFKLINIDPYANAFNDGPTGAGWQTDDTEMSPEVYERKYEIDSMCYPIRLAYEYWERTGDSSVFGEDWLKAVSNMLRVFCEQQRKQNKGSYHFYRVTDRTYDTVGWGGYGAPVKPVGLIASVFRPSDDRTSLPFLVPSNFMAVSSLRKASEILKIVNRNDTLAEKCDNLADEVEGALKKYAVVNHPTYGKIYAYEVDGYGNRLLMDDANVPSLLSLLYLGDVDTKDKVYKNTRRFVLSEDNPWFFRGKVGEGIGGPHIGYDMVWPMSIIMRAFTSSDDKEIADCIKMLLNTDADTGFIHESFHKDNAHKYTRDWFAWQNTLFGELILKLISDGKTSILINTK